MRSLRWLLLIVTSLIGLPCRALPADGGSTGFRISGVVVSSRDGSPVPYLRLNAVLGTQIQAEMPNRGPGARGMRMGGIGRGRTNTTPDHEVVADDHGRFVMKLPSGGGWQLSAGGRGFHRQHYDEHEGFFSSIVLTSAKPTAEVSFRVDPDASISGLVLDEAGEPVQNGQVTVEFGDAEPLEGFQPGRRQAGFGQTDDRGRYELTGLAPGAYIVRIQAHPWYAQQANFGGARANARLDPSLDVTYETVWYPGTADPKSAEVIRLKGGEERQADFHLVAMPSVHLRIDPVVRNEPAGGGEVRRQPQSSVTLTKISPEGGFSQTMNGEGADFGGLTAGVYQVEVRGADGQPEGDVRQFRVLAGSGGVVDLSGATVMTKVKVLTEGVDENQLGALTFTDRATGRSSFAANPNQGFHGLRPRGVDQGAGDRSQERVVYLNPGTYDVRLAGVGPNFLMGLAATGAKVSGLTVEVGAEPATVTVKAGSGKAQVSGVAKMGAGPVQGAMVLLVPAMLGQPNNASEVERDQTNSDGSFRIERVVPGKYILVAIDHGWEVNWHDPQTLAGYLAHGVPVEVAAGSKAVRNIEAVVP